MNCEPLAYTGSGQLGLLFFLGLGCLLGGSVLILTTRRRGRAATVVLLALFVTSAAVSIAAGTPTHALADSCPEADSAIDINSGDLESSAKNWLTIVQTSVLEDLAPGIEPVTITGIVSNNGADSTYITAIEVEITGVSTDPGSPPGSCDASDYVLRNTLMPVGQTLGPETSAVFSGALIGFNNKSTNQDTCKGATISLLYTANPG